MGEEVDENRPAGLGRFGERGDGVGPPANQIHAGSAHLRRDAPQRRAQQPGQNQKPQPMSIAGPRTNVTNLGRLICLVVQWLAGC